ncbi:MAG: alpha-amylase [Spirochaetales bacterium]|jgi:glycosidase|nr:alpha-amylase [Spirochaetales bacterium]
MSKLVLEREFHISRAAREKYAFDEALYGLEGNVIFSNFAAVRNFAAKINKKRNAAKHPEKAVRAGQLHAMGLIDEILHYVVKLYLKQHGPHIFSKALEAVRAVADGKDVADCMAFFIQGFPPISVYRGELTLEEYLASETKGVPNQEIVLEEMLMLWLENDNPAFAPFGELFDDTDLRGRTRYQKVIGILKEFFEGMPPFGPHNHFLIDMLKEPVVASPYSLQGQLEYIRTHWGYFLGDFLERLLRGMDLIREEDKMRGFAGGGSSEVYSYFGEGYGDEEFERFSMDKDWMPKVVLIAKSVLVWLDQLSRKYSRRIAALDAIPDEELDILADRGINGLWLIGLWERSSASRRIKELCGNPEAAASAYSLLDYNVSPGLGGWDALNNLRHRAGKRGIRLASDMVPNHTGIDSKWMVEHPEYFIQSSHPPFPSYSFNGENLHPDSDVGIFIEDHYYSREDAAVVFKRIHWPSGDTRYIYHGNDGTHMPWNDTAQLNFLLPEVREAVIQMIMHVARNFPIIRFDAAMTLAKRHFARLWYPEPGRGGDIPSRAERGLSKDEFNRVFPVEFWREVVDRVAAECPDTLLLAEAFWMMEGYFVRTLGMHRVYNSAFMNMLKKEENEKYRLTIKNTQEFDKDILKRFVNFMNNPDEETAIAQFGDGDKYFGVCTLMVTMPGLPMFGHGQVEGFTEKYGMEYRRAYRDEKPNQDLVKRHEREIFPLLKKRYLFAEVSDFLLYDLYDEHQHVNGNVFAYSNRCGDEKALVLYNNAYDSAWGWIRVSAAYREKDGKKLVRRSLADGFGLRFEEGMYCIFREQRSNLWFIRSSREMHEQGLFINLRGYETQVFLDVYEVADDERGNYRRLAEFLEGVGMENIDASMREITFQPLYAALRKLLYDWYPSLKAALLEVLAIGKNVSSRGKKETEAFVTFSEADLEGFTADARDFIAQANNFSGRNIDSEKAAFSILDRLEISAKFLQRLRRPRFFKNTMKACVMDSWKFLTGFEDIHAAAEILFTYSILQSLDDVSLFDEWSLNHEITRFLIGEDCGRERAEYLCLLLKILLHHGGWYDTVKKFNTASRPERALEYLFNDTDVQRYTGVNTFDGEVYFNKEGFLSLVWWLGAIALIRKPSAGDSLGEKYFRESGELVFIGAWLSAYETAEYKLHRLFESGAKKSGAKKPAVKKPGAKKPGTKKPAVKKPGAKKPVKKEKKPHSGAAPVKKKVEKKTPRIRTDRKKKPVTGRF